MNLVALSIEFSTLALPLCYVCFGVCNPFPQIETMVSRGWATPAFSLWNSPVFLSLVYYLGLAELDPGQSGSQNLQTPWNFTSPQHISAVAPKGRRALPTQPWGALPEFGLNFTTPVAQRSSAGVEKYMKNLCLEAEHSDMSCLCSFSLFVFTGRSS